MPEVVVAKPREGKFNKNAARRVRAAGKIPAVLYGPGTIRWPSRWIPSRSPGSCTLNVGPQPSFAQPAYAPATSFAQRPVVCTGSDLVRGSSADLCCSPADLRGSSADLRGASADLCSPDLRPASAVCAPADLCRAPADLRSPDLRSPDLCSPDLRPGNVIRAADHTVMPTGRRSRSSSPLPTQRGSLHTSLSSQKA